jgi:hypothetical protein
MIGLLHSLGLTRPSLTALLIVCLAPAAASAQHLRFRNETSGVIIIQTSSVVGGVVRQGPRYQLNPNDVTPAVLLPGNRIIAIYDNPRNPNRLLFQGTIPAGTEDLGFGIVADAPAPRVKIEPRRLPAKPAQPMKP